MPAGSEMPSLPVTVVVPTLNAAKSLPGSLDALSNKVRRIIVTDGGSSDATRELAEERGAVVIESSRGRGPQLRMGAESALRQADCDWLLFLHADTILQAGWVEAVTGHLALPDSEDLAGYFRLRLDDTAPAAWRVERLVAWRCRTFALPYGDQGLLIHRSLYEAVGGFQPLPLMEDVDLVRRIGCSRLRLLEADALTSAARYRRDGYWRRPARNLSLLALYFLGVAPERLVRWYG